ncbi:hypothetical protein PPACK8108_LOCUS671 [Phakopsora pachyrhizi]|uniref:Uncharacterized protein n=1 Tax=Phakopsora pachyrhizi TaxID=170000 RepID=A0AAV0AE20_PHAPC|nr:hypothetical protein PPACK8108_LOCUS671 [Phakopsora pachyrhizi]
MSGGTRGALRMQQNLNNSQLVDHPPREEDIQKNPLEQNPNLQQPIPVPDEQQNPAQALLALQNENLFNRRANVPAGVNNPANQEAQRRNSHGQMLDQVNRAVVARNIPPASSGLARPLSAFAKCMLGMDKNRLVEAQTDTLDYDLRGWEPVEYEYLKVYLAVNSESKISEYTEDRDLIRVKSPKTNFCLTWISPNKK